MSSVNILINVSNKHTYYLQLMIIYIDRYKVDQGHTRYEIILRNSPKREINNALIEQTDGMAQPNKILRISA